MKRFTKTKEDFICSHCGAHVRGNGYTNHCPHCLWSRHVDQNPGDRQNMCRGMMEPLRLEMKKGEFVIIHRCQKCGAETKTKTQKEDNVDVILNSQGTIPGFVYILKDDNGKYYIGSTNRIPKRMRRHELGYTQTTRNMKNPQLVLVQEYSTLAEARQIEYKLKKLKRKDYIETIIKDGYIKLKPKP